MQAAVHIVGRNELGDCPAAVSVDVESGDTIFLTNRDVFPLMSDGEQLFILAHELGHRLTGSPDETVADAFALGLTAGRRRRSLKVALATVASMENVPYARLAALYDLCLRVDHEKDNDMNNRYKHPLFTPEGYFQFEGQEPAAVADPIDENADQKTKAEEALMLGKLLGGRELYRRPGVHVGNWFISAELIVMVFIAVCAMVCAARLRKLL